MSGTIYQAAAGALLQQMRLEILSNNLANVNTAGYKADLPLFRIPDAGPVQLPGESLLPGLMSPYAPPMEARTDFTPGSLVRTGNPLDVAVVGPGFFQIETAEGTRFTRQGNFTINPQGLLATADGWPVMGQGGEITIEGSRVDIKDSGDIYVDGERVDTLRVVDFTNSEHLRKTGQTLFSADKGAGMHMLGAGEIHTAQGFVESSNVDAIRAMTELIETMRVFEAYQRVIRTADETTSKTVNEVGRSA